MVMRVRVTGLEAVGAAKNRVRQVIGAAILDLDDDLKRNSPVRDGYFVNSWQAQANGQPAPREGFDGPRPGTSTEDAATIFGGVGGVVSLVNPARSTGPALFVGGWALAQLWLFWLAPLLGAALAGLTYRTVFEETKAPSPA